jgi:hypothetical protein
VTDAHGRRGPDAASADVADAERAARFDLARLPDGFYADPYPDYRALRTHEPV